MDSIKPIYKLLTHKNSQLEDLITRAKALKKQNFLLKSVLPEGYAEHCEFVPHSANGLTLLVDSSLIATQLQYQTKEILNKISMLNGYQAIQNITIKVNPLPEYKPPEKPTAITTPIPSSESGSQLVYSLSESVDDADLANALQRLAGHLKQDDR